MRAFLAVAVLCLVASSPADARPAGCPRAWCGCWMMRRHGLTDRRLWQARQWVGVGAASSLQRGVIVVYPHHVVEVTDVLTGGLIRAISGNDGHAVRDRVRSLRGHIAIRRL